MTGREQRESIRHVESVLKIRSRLSQLAFQPELKVKCFISLFSFTYINYTSFGMGSFYHLLNISGIKI